VIFGDPHPILPPLRGGRGGSALRDSKKVTFKTKIAQGYF